jgi:hypothetical protein
MLTLKRKKSIIIKTDNRVVVKEIQIYFIGLKKRLVWVVFEIEEIRDKEQMKQVWKREEV